MKVPAHPLGSNVTSSELTPLPQTDDAKSVLRARNKVQDDDTPNDSLTVLKKKYVPCKAYIKSFFVESLSQLVFDL